jgi:hypothetical protein
MTPQEFIDKWERVELSERATYQSHFIDLCALVGHAAPIAHDGTGEVFTFEKGVRTTEGGQGFADVWFKGHFAFEYKQRGKHKDLSAAYQQLQRYRENLENPPLLVVTDIAHWEIHTNFTSTAPKVYKFTHRQIAEPATLRLLKHLFHDPDRLRPDRDTAQVTREAAASFKAIVDNMRSWEAEPDRIAHFLTKLVFCLFAEDAGLLPRGMSGERGIFAEIVRETRQKPDDFVLYVQQLFQAMADGGKVLLRDIPYFNGSLFDDVDVARLGHEALSKLWDACQLDWSAVEPSIFGTLFERTLDPKKRAQLGAHYTSRDDILLIVEPVLMQPLRREWATLRAQAHTLNAEHAAATTPRARTNAINALKALQQQMLERLRSIRVLDPACGSGNFLYVSLQLLMDMEKEIITDPLFVVEGMTTPFPEVHPRQIYGIERDPIAHGLASIVVWIGYLQWREQNGYSARHREPILEAMSDHVVCMDAIMTVESPHPKSLSHAMLTHRGRGTLNESREAETLDDAASSGAALPNDSPETLDSPLPAALADQADATSSARQVGEGQGVRAVREPDWPAVDVIVGNPPFLGGYKLWSELGRDYATRLFNLYEGRVPPASDLVTYWYEKARAHIKAGKAKRAGLLATNSIRGGANREVLKRIKADGDIFMAWGDREWILEGAAVRVSMVGFDDGSEIVKVLDGAVVNSINADLTSGVDIIHAARLSENSNICYRGNEKQGSFDIPAKLAQDMMAAKNKSGLPNSDVVQPYINAKDVVQRSRDVWIIDFFDRTKEEAEQYELPFAHVLQHVKPERDKNNRAHRRDNWWKHGEIIPNMRRAIAKTSRYIVTPSVSKHRVFTWLDKIYVPDHQLHVIARDDDYFFGVLHSRFHELWSLRMGTSLEDRPRYTPTTTFETFPFPWSPGKEDTASPHYAAISAAAQALHAERAAWLGKEGRDRTLTNLYNALNIWRGKDKGKTVPAAADFAPRLDDLHRALDAAVCAAYGWDADVLQDEEEILRRLLALNLARANDPHTTQSDDRRTGSL